MERVIRYKRRIDQNDRAWIGAQQRQGFRGDEFLVQDQCVGGAESPFQDCGIVSFNIRNDGYVVAVLLQEIAGRLKMEPDQQVVILVRVVSLIRVETDARPDVAPGTASGNKGSLSRNAIQNSLIDQFIDGTVGGHGGNAVAGGKSPCRIHRRIAGELLFLDHFAQQIRQIRNAESFLFRNFVSHEVFLSCNIYCFIL